MRNGMYAYVGILLAIAIAFALSGLTSGCTKSVEASTTPPAGWTCHDDGTCTKLAARPATPADEFGDESGEGEEMPALVPVASRKRVIEMPATLVEGCAPVDEPGRITFCESEVDSVVGPDALAAE